MIIDRLVDLQLLRFLFEEMLNGRANRFASSRFQSRPREHGVETEEQYQARITRQRQEQAAAAQRRKNQEEAWKERRQMERENGCTFNYLNLFRLIAFQRPVLERNGVSRKQVPRGQKQKHCVHQRRRKSATSNGNPRSLDPLHSRQHGEEMPNA